MTLASLIGGMFTKLADQFNQGVGLSARGDNALSRASFKGGKF